MVSLKWSQHKQFWEVTIRLFSPCFKFTFLYLLCEDGEDSAFVLCHLTSCLVQILGHWREGDREAGEQIRVFLLPLRVRVSPAVTLHHSRTILSSPQLLSHPPPAILQGTSARCRRSPSQKTTFHVCWTFFAPRWGLSHLFLWVVVSPCS